MTIFGDKDRDCTQPGDHKPPRKSWMFRISMTIIGVVLASTVIFTVAQIAPYSDVTVTWTSELEVDEFTSEGVPVLREGEPYTYSIDYCNNGHAIRTVRWLDSFGSVDQVTNIDSPANIVSSSRLLSETLYPTYPEATGCFDDLEVRVQLGLQINTGVYYSLRTVSSYRPNFLHEEVYENRSELFYYAEEGAELP